VPEFDEFAAIARFFAPLARAEPGANGLTDDGATLALPAGEELAITTDTLIEGVHFLPDDPAGDVAAKALAVNLSDLASMGARPRAYLLALALPRVWGASRIGDWLGRFSAGLAEAQAAAGVALVGGDTVTTPGPLSLTVTALGTVSAGAALRRSGARAGDLVWVSGTLGDAALGLAVLRGGLAGVAAADRESLIARYRRPPARVALGRALVGLAHAAADVSDGLVADLGHICRASAVSAIVEVDRLPLSPAVRAALAAEPALIGRVLDGGDDYELVFGAAADAAADLAAIASRLDLPLTAIGRLVAGNGPVTVLDGDGRAVETGTGGYRHF
jgi:thiamine-monophosphate kinase